MSQPLAGDFTLDPYNLSGIALTDALNRMHGGFKTSNSGSARPPWAQPGTVWLDTSISPPGLKLFDGSADYIIARAAPNVLAVSFSPSAAYFTGETVTGPDGLVYQAKGPITPGTWDATKWNNISANVLNSLMVESRSGPGGSQLDYRNRVINGACNIAQRAAALSFNAGTGGYAGPDRFYCYNGTSNGKVAQSTATYQIPGGGPLLNAIQQYIDAVPSDLSAGNLVGGIMQIFEGWSVYDLIGQKVTVSFWFKAKLPGKYSASLRDGSVGNSCVTTFDYLAADQPQRIVLNFPALPSNLSIPLSSANGLYMSIGSLNTGNLQTSSLDTWAAGNKMTAPGTVNWAATLGNYILGTRFKLEPGPVDTPYDQPIPSVELAQCQRYCEIINIDAIRKTDTSGTHGGGLLSLPYKVTKRVIPSFTFFSGVNATGTQGVLTINGSTQSGSITGSPKIDGISLWNTSALVAIGDYAGGSVLLNSELT